MKTYEITTAADFLKVPSDRRGACLREFEYALELLELAAGSDTFEMSAPFVWTDDGRVDVSLSINGEDELRLTAERAQ